MRARFRFPALLLLAACAGLAASPARAEATLLDYYVSPVDGSHQPFRYYLPFGHTTGGPAKYPCVIYLHGFGGRASGGVSAAQAAFADGHGWILAFPDGRGAVNYDHVGEQDVLAVRQALIDTQDADPERIYLQGFSMGGHGSYRLGLRFPDLFAAVSPQAGWTDFNQFYPQWYQQTTSPKLPAYVDPTRASLLGHTAALPQAENGLNNFWRVFYRSSDTTNPPVNAEVMIDAWTALGHPPVAVELAGGHSPEPNEDAYPFFDGKSANPDRPVVVYRTWHLRHDGAYWVHIGAFREREQQARIRAEAFVSENRIAVETSNVARFTLSPSAALVSGASNAVVEVDGEEAFNGTWSGPLTLALQLDGEGLPAGWAPAGAPPSGVQKVKGLEGPVDEASLGPFVVVYGASKGDSDPDTIQNKKDAELFCGCWNGQTILRWSAQSVSGNWWEQGPVSSPYPFSTGSLMTTAEHVRPVSDADAASLDLSGKHLILFGDPSSNTFIDAIRSADVTPVKMAADGQSVTVDGRTYSGATVRWGFVYPRHDDAGTLAYVSKGFMSSLPELNWDAFSLGKDLEQWPWQLPDYFVWDTTRPATGQVVVSSQFKYFPEQYLEAGFFTQDWQLDTEAPVARGRFEGTVDPNDSEAFVGAGFVVCDAADKLGESGVASVEFKKGAGAWQPYTGPIPLGTLGTTTFAFRATDRGLSFLYGPDAGTGFVRATGAVTHTGAESSFDVTINKLTVSTGGVLLARFSGRLAAPTAKTQPGDRASAKIELGEDLLPGGAAGAAVTVQIGPLVCGPYTTDAKGRFEGAAGAGGSAKGKVSLRRRRFLKLNLKNVDLEAALGIAPGAPNGTAVPLPLTVTLDADTAGPANYPAELRRRNPAGGGMVRFNSKSLLAK